MKVAELEGTHLDYWVARAEGRDTRNWGVVPRDAWYSSRWELAGPIIERARIGFFVTAGLADGMQYAASCDRHVLTSIYGPTPLIAAMRAYVVSVFGDEVPDLDA